MSGRAAGRLRAEVAQAAGRQATGGPAEAGCVRSQRMPQAGEPQRRLGERPRAEAGRAAGELRAEAGRAAALAHPTLAEDGVAEGRRPRVWRRAASSWTGQGLTGSGPSRDAEDEVEAGSTHVDAPKGLRLDPQQSNRVLQVYG